jgi:hypothetical protein
MKINPIFNEEEIELIIKNMNKCLYEKYNEETEDLIFQLTQILKINKGEVE